MRYVLYDSIKKQELMSPPKAIFFFKNFENHFRIWRLPFSRMNELIEQQLMSVGEQPTLYMNMGSGLVFHEYKK